MCKSKDDNQDIFLKGIGFSGFRSIGSKPIFLYPLKKINLIIGINNSGKSNITLFLSQYLKDSNKLQATDYHKYDHSILKKVYSPISLKPLEIQLERTDLDNIFINFLKSDIFYYDKLNNIFWDTLKDKGELENIDCPQTVKSYTDIYNSLTPPSQTSYGGNKYDKGILFNILNCTYRKKMSYDKHLEIILIPAIRELFNKVECKFLKGLDQNIIEKMDYLQNPNVDDEESVKIFKKIQTFLKEVLEDQQIELIVPARRDTLQIKKSDGKRYELSQLGTGIHEIIYLAFVTSIFPNSLICIDEPEIHMHPRLQKKLISYLNDNTDCQYIITTHSAHLIDETIDPSIFRTSMNTNNETEVINIISDKSKFELIKELGYKASDIFQTNCILWVEGPSDRLYLNYWIKGIEPKYIEGIHYSIMFYGGRLLSHLNGLEDNESIDDTISLLTINKFSFIVMDSDKNSENKDINNTKKRIIKEFNTNHWLTAGREIENYLNPSAFEIILKDQWPSEFTDIKIGQYKNQLKKDNGKSINKIKFAKLYIENNPKPDYSVLYLNDSMKKITNFIKEANQ